MEEPHPVRVARGRAKVRRAAVADDVLRPEDGALERRLDVVPHQPADGLGARLVAGVAKDLVGRGQEGGLGEVWKSGFGAFVSLGGLVNKVRLFFCSKWPMRPRVIDEK